MPRYRIFHLKDSHVATFRHATPKKPPYRVKLRYYDECGGIDAINPYAAWKALQYDEPEQAIAGDKPPNRTFGVGDILESDDSSLWICQFWGFEAAEWILPENEFNRDAIESGSAFAQDLEAESPLQAMPAGAL